MLRARALIAAGLFAAACSQVSKQNLLTINVQGGHTIAPGKEVSFTVFGRTVEGTTTTPASGAKITLTATEGTVDHPSVTLGSDGTATAKFTACDPTKDSTCSTGTVAVVKASGTIGGEALTTAVGFTLSTGSTTSSTCDASHPDCSQAACDGKACSDASGASGTCDATSGACKTAATAGKGAFSLAVEVYDSNDVPLPFTTGSALTNGPPFSITAIVTDQHGNPGAGQTVVFSADNDIGQFATTPDGDYGASQSETTDVGGKATAWFKPGGTMANGTITVVLQGTSQRVDVPFHVYVPSPDQYSLVLTLYDDSGVKPRAAMRAPAESPPFKVVATLITNDTKTPGLGQTVDFSVDGAIGQFATAANGTFAATVSATTDANGDATVWFQPGDSPANGTISAVVHGTDIRADTPFDIVLPGTLVFLPPVNDPDFGIMGVKTSGFREQQVLTFELLDSTDQPFNGQATLVFSIDSDCGVSFAPQQTPLGVNGEASLTVYSGTSAGTFAVHAQAYLGQDTTGKVIAETTSSTIAVVGAKANGRNFSVRCEHASIPSLVRNDCSFMWTDIKENCTAVVGDRFNNRLGAGGVVTWYTEAGLFGPPSPLPVAVPTKTDDGSLGRATNVLSTLGARMPEDVPPWPNEFTVPQDPNDPCVAADGSPRVRNPRDGLVTFIVTTQGEEGFFDANGNGQYDPGEDFIDEGEPYIDANDNNKWDPGEFFIDENGNGKYDGPNGKWDANTTLWAVGHILMTSHGKYGNPDPSSLALAPGASATVQFTWQDENGNAPSYQATTFGAGVVGKGQVTLLAPVPNQYLDGFGTLSVADVTTCDEQTHICKLETHIIPVGGALGSGAFELVGYTAPGAAPFADTVIATATTVAGQYTVVDDSDVPVIPAP